MELLSVGDLVGAGEYRLLSRFRGAVAFTPERKRACWRRTPRLACVVEEAKGQGPLNIVVRGLDLAAVDSLEVRAGHVRLGQAREAIRRRYDSGLRLNGAKPEILRTNLATLKRALLVQCPAGSLAFLLDGISLTPALSPNGGEGEGFETALARALRAGTERLLAGDLEGGAAALKGLGHGLTPSGDDFLAGFLLGLNALQSGFGVDFGTQILTIRRAARSGNRFAEAFLDCAARGRYSEHAKGLVKALFEDAGADIPVLARRVLAYGATSGADLAVGLFCALEQHRPAAACMETIS